MQFSIISVNSKNLKFSNNYRLKSKGLIPLWPDKNDWNERY